MKGRGLTGEEEGLFDGFEGEEVVEGEEGEEESRDALVLFPVAILGMLDLDWTGLDGEREVGRGRREEWTVWKVDETRMETWEGK